MKTPLIILLLVTFTNVSVIAQTAEDTAKWLNSKKVELLEKPSDLSFSARQIDTTDSNNKKFYIFARDITTFQFSPKLSIQGRWRDADSIASEPVRSYSIRSSADPDLLKRFVIALRHLANANGAKLADDELF